MYKLTEAFKQYKLVELEQISLPEDRDYKSSAYDYASYLVHALKQMELRVVKTQWAIGYSDTLYGCVQLSPINSDKEVQQINDFGLPGSILKLYTRFSPSSQVHAPTFFGAVFVDLTEDPFVVSSRFLGDKIHQAQNNFIEDAIEKGASEVSTFSYTVKDTVALLKKKKITRQQGFGILTDSVFQTKLPMTKLKKALECLAEIDVEKTGKLNGIDVLKSAYAIHTSFSVPDQYDFLSKAVPVILDSLK